MRTEEVLIKETASHGNPRDDSRMSVGGVRLPDIGVRGLQKAGPRRPLRKPWCAQQRSNQWRMFVLMVRLPTWQLFALKRKPTT